MRVTPETKAATRIAILQSARQLFAERGFESTTTRDIARDADIASGTLFNYFTTKEAIVASMANDALAETLVTFHAAEAETLEEALFSMFALNLRKLRPLRKYLPALLTTLLSPLANDPDNDAAAFRLAHLETVERIAAKHDFGELSPVSLQLYWSLFMGVLAFWADDKSPKQEDTLALADEAVNMFVAWFDDQSPKKSKQTR